LNELVKQSQLKTSAGDKQKNKKKKDEEEEEPDIEALLYELKQNIIKVYQHGPNSYGRDIGEMQGKDPINILHEIEMDINNNIKSIDYVFKKDATINDKGEILKNGPWYDLVKVQEGKRWTERFEESKRQRDEQDRIVKT
jgi:hypothetical protein